MFSLFRFQRRLPGWPRSNEKTFLSINTYLFQKRSPTESSPRVSIILHCLIIEKNRELGPNHMPVLVEVPDVK